jgi:hypothetical protein
MRGKSDAEAAWACLNISPRMAAKRVDRYQELGWMSQSGRSSRPHRLGSPHSQSGIFLSARFFGVP